MARQAFIDQLKSLGYAVEKLTEDRIAFQYVPRTGRFRGQQLTLGFAVGDDFPANCPSGPHVKPRLLPLKPDGDKHPYDRIHESPFGGEWQYWSRPFPKWNDTPALSKTAKTYMEHIDRLFDQ